MFFFLKLNSKAYSLVELLITVALLVILMSMSTVAYVRYKTNSQIQTLKNHGSMMAKSLLNCMFYEEQSKDCLLNIPDDGQAYDLEKHRLFKKIELTKFEEPVQNLKASWNSSSNTRNFCLQFKRNIHNQMYKLCVDVDRKTKVIRSVIVNSNFCCKKAHGSCLLPLRPQSQFIGDVSSASCKNKGFSNDFFSYLSNSGFYQARCRQGVCIQ